MRTQLRLLYHNTRQHLFKHIQTFQQQNYYNKDVKSTITYLTTSKLKKKNNNLKKNPPTTTKTCTNGTICFISLVKMKILEKQKKLKKTMEDGTTI